MGEAYEQGYAAGLRNSDEPNPYEGHGGKRYGSYAYTAYELGWHKGNLAREMRAKAASLVVRMGRREAEPYGKASGRSRKVRDY